MNYLMSIEPLSEDSSGIFKAKYVTRHFEMRECTLTLTPNQQRYWVTLDEGRRWIYATHLVNRKGRE
jgi:hypothetical protein